jgi:hypothetical protein
MSYLGERTMDRRRFLWDWIDEHHPEAFATPGYPGLKSPALRAAAIAALVKHLGLTGHASWQQRVPETVGRWLDNPDRFSPHVDEVALELAVGFDWDAIAGLTLTEYGVLLGRLDAMRDPFDWSTEDRTADGLGGASTLVSASRRRWAYLRGSARQRHQLAETLARKRMRAAGVAA